MGRRADEMQFYELMNCHTIVEKHTGQLRRLAPQLSGVYFDTGIVPVPAFS